MSAAAGGARPAAFIRARLSRDDSDSSPPSDSSDGDFDGFDAASEPDDFASPVAAAAPPPVGFQVVAQPTGDEDDLFEESLQDEDDAYGDDDGFEGFSPPSSYVFPVNFDLMTTAVVEERSGDRVVAGGDDNNAIEEGVGDGDLATVFDRNTATALVVVAGGDDQGLTGSSGMVIPNFSEKLGLNFVPSDGFDSVTSDSRGVTEFAEGTDANIPATAAAEAEEEGREAGDVAPDSTDIDAGSQSRVDADLPEEWEGSENSDDASRPGSESLDDTEDTGETAADDYATLATLLKAADDVLHDKSSGIGSKGGGLLPTAVALPPGVPLGGPPSMNGGKDKQQAPHSTVEMLKIKFLRLVHRLGCTPEHKLVAQVLHRLGLAEDDRATVWETALWMEKEGTEELDFSCRMLVVGKTGAGKSATVNSIIGEEKSATGVFAPTTSSTKELCGTVNGIQLHIVDTPGLSMSSGERSRNRKILSSIKKIAQRCQPDVVLYVDRMDDRCDGNDMPLLQLICDALGPSVWSRAVLVLTHAGATPPEGPSGMPVSSEVLADRRSFAIRKTIWGAGERMVPLTALVENHPSCRRSRDGEKVLPSGVAWRPELLLLCYSLKIVSDAERIGAIHALRNCSGLVTRLLPPVDHVLSSILRKGASRNGDAVVPIDGDPDDAPEHGSSSTIVAVPDLSLPPAFDGDCPTYRYRHSEHRPHIAVLPLKAPIAWDHDSGYSGFVIESRPDVKGQLLPASAYVKAFKDKELFTLEIDSISAEHGEGKSTHAGLDVEAINGQFACTVLGEAQYDRTKGMLSLTFLGKDVLPGVKLAHDWPPLAGSQLTLAGSAGAVIAGNGPALGANLEARLQDNIRHSASVAVVGLSFLLWRRELGIRANARTKLSVTRFTEAIVNVGMNNNSSGLLSVRVRTAEHVHAAALFGAVRIVAGVMRSMWATRVEAGLR